MLLYSGHLSICNLPNTFRLVPLFIYVTEFPYENFYLSHLCPRPIATKCLTPSPSLYDIIYELPLTSVTFVNSSKLGIIKKYFHCYCFLQTVKQ